MHKDIEEDEVKTEKYKELKFEQVRNQFTEGLHPSVQTLDNNIRLGDLQKQYVSLQAVTLEKTNQLTNRWTGWKPWRIIGFIREEQEAKKRVLISNLRMAILQMYLYIKSRWSFGDYK